MRRVLLRSVAVLGLGILVLGGVLYVASTVDSRPPSVTRIGLTQHLAADEAVALSTSSIEIDFSEPVDHASAERAFAIDPSVKGSFSWTGSTLTFTPSERLPLETAFTVQVRPGTRDAAGNQMSEAPPAFAFQTAGSPQVAAMEPANGATGVALDAPIRITFSTLMDTATVEEALRISPTTSYELRWNGEVLTILPSEPLRAGRRYTLRIATSARDVTGTPLAGPWRGAFSTVESGLSATTLVPADGTEGIAPTTPIAILFDAPIDPDSVRADLLTVDPDVAGTLEALPLPGAAGLASDAPTALVFTPSGPLQAATTYEVALQPGIRSADGAELAEPLSWTFTTSAPTATLSNQIVFLSDRAGVTNLWAMNADGSNQRQLSSELSPVTMYAVSPDGRRFVVGDGARLVEARADGSDRRVLTPDGVLEFDPAYSPDGSTLVSARAELATGSGLGLWQRTPGGGDATALELPDELLRPTPSPSPEPSGGASASPAPQVAPLLRAPRFSPDGAAIAFVDAAGRVGVLELPGARLTTAPFVAETPPAWLPDSTGVLLSGREGTVGEGERTHAPREPVLPLDIGPPAETERLATLHVVRLDRGADSVTPLLLGDGAARPAIDPSGRIAYVLLRDDPGAGSLWLATPRGSARSPLLPGRLVARATFGQDPALLLVDLAAEDESPARIGVLDIARGQLTELAEGGSQPRWLP